MAKEEYKGLVAIDMANGMTYIGRLYMRKVMTPGIGLEYEKILKEVIITQTSSNATISLEPQSQDLKKKYKALYEWMTKLAAKTNSELPTILINIEHAVVPPWNLD